MGDPSRSPAAIFDVDGVLVDGSLGIAFTEHEFEDEYPYAGGIDHAVEKHKNDQSNDGRTSDFSYDMMAAEVVKHWRQGLQERDAAAIREHAAAFAMEYPLKADAEPILTELETRGYDIYLVSINPQEVLAPFADRRLPVPIAGVYGTVLTVDDHGRYDGGTARDLITGTNSKASVLPEIFDTSARTGSVAVGDAVTDLPLFEQVDTGVLIMGEGEELERLREHGKSWDYRFPTVQGLRRALPEVLP